jgi:alanine racemase
LAAGEKLMDKSEIPLRAAWIEIDLLRLRENFRLLGLDKAASLQIMSVLKDNAYGHGMVQIAQTALESGATALAVSTLDEGIELRKHGIPSPILLLGERQEAELPWCIEECLTCCVHDHHTVEKLGKLASLAGKKVPVHLKINTGMNRYGVRWSEAFPLASRIAAEGSLILEGVFSHFSMSDETDKTFALLQLERFNQVLSEMAAKDLRVKYRHLSNSGGFLDLPQARFDMVRIGLLQFGVYPSKVCRRIPGIGPVMTVKARIAAVQNLQPNDFVGYGLRYQATSPRRIAVIPIGYGDGFPRVRNQGCVLIHGKRAPLVGGVAMDALMVDITEISEAAMWDEAVIMGRQGEDEISVHEVASWKNSVSYDVLTGWRERLPRVYVNGNPA